jgi:hypothetical protein
VSRWFPRRYPGCNKPPSAAKDIALFRRTKTTDAPATVALKPDGKGRPTPTRKEAEAAAKARAKATLGKKQSGRSARQQRAQQNAKAREAMKSGDERYLPKRDKGHVRRFIRDYVDARLCMAELLLPLLIIIMVTQPIAQGLSNGLWSATVLLVGLDTALLMFRLRRELRRRFPDESTKGATSYALLRSLQLRWLRLPKPQVKLGAKLPDRY